MSRIGNKIIEIPEGVSISVDGSTVTVKGPKGELTQKIDRDLSIEIEDGQMTVKRPTDQKRHKSMQGLYRSLIANMVVGVSEGYTKVLELVGVGYKADNKGQLLDLALGYSHNFVFDIPEEVSVRTETVKGQPPRVFLESIDKQLVGQVAAKIRSLRKPEPYKGKGVRYQGEQIRRKAGKSAAAG